jgi:hypothetical protein
MILARRMFVVQVNYIKGLPRVAKKIESYDENNLWTSGKKYEVVWYDGSTFIYSYYKENPIDKLPTRWWSCCGERVAWQMEVDRQMTRALVSV